MVVAERYVLANSPGHSGQEASIVALLLTQAPSSVMESWDPFFF